MKSKLSAGKGRKVVKAIIEVAVGGDRGEFNHATLSLHTSLETDSYNRVLKLTFQRHALTFGMSCERYSDLERFREDLPPNEYDFGAVAYSKFYAGHVTGSDMDANGPGANRMRVAANIIDKVMETMRDYNLHLVTRDDLLQWQKALEKLDVEIEVRRWVGNTRYTAMWELAEHLKAPATKTFNTRWDASLRGTSAT